jgi:hypothetical protein
MAVVSTGSLYAEGDDSVPPAGAAFAYDSSGSGLAKAYGWNGSAVTQMLLSGQHNIDPGDLFSGLTATGWTDFAASLGLAGFDATPTVTAMYKLIGRLCHVYLNVSGTASGTAVRFNTPVLIDDYVGGSCLGLIRVYHNGAYAVGCLVSDDGYNNRVLVGNSIDITAGWTAGAASFTASITFHADAIPAP